MNNLHTVTINTKKSQRRFKFDTETKSLYGSLNLGDGVKFFLHTLWTYHNSEKFINQDTPIPASFGKSLHEGADENTYDFLTLSHRVSCSFNEDGIVIVRLYSGEDYSSKKYRKDDFSWVLERWVPGTGKKFYVVLASTDLWTHTRRLE